MNTDLKPIERALVSVSDKSGIVDFAQELGNRGVEILSTGGTYRLLKENDIAATDVSSYTGFPEIMGGRVKTLHPKIHGGILARRGTDNAVMAEHGIGVIDLVLVNLYPFETTVANPDCSLGDAVENIDIGGPAMIRAAAKNHPDVAVVVDTGDYQAVLAEMNQNGGQLSGATRFDLAVKAYEQTAAYDGAIANYFGRLVPDGNKQFPRTFNSQFVKAQNLRYGENPHQNSAFYIEKPRTECASVATAVQRQGKQLSYNNIVDTDTALETARLFDEPACVIVKHANPCGVAIAETIGTAYERAFATDTESAFGGIIAFNRELDSETAIAIVAQQFVEVIIAPGIAEAAREALAAKKNIRLLECGELNRSQPSFDFKRVHGGLLVQDPDLGVITSSNLKVVTKRQPTEDEIRDLLFTWKVAKMVKSNAIVYGKNGRTIGVGAGQMSRVNSARIASIKAEHADLEVQGSCMASDAFLPFRDGIDNAASAGVSCVIQPGGSMRDDETIAAADEHGLAMVFTGMRHFRH